jgi:anthranilate phosphoribosyltransferase
MKFVGPIRRQMGVKTFFNMLGPIVNPIQPKYQSVGVFSLKLQRLYSHIFQKSEKNYNILYDLGGYDEYSNTGTTKLIRRSGAKLVDPSHFNLKAFENKDIFGGDTVQEAAKIFSNLLENNCPQAHKEVVSANAAIALSLYEKDKSLESLFHESMELIESGKANEKFKDLVRLSQQKTKN